MTKLFKEPRRIHFVGIGGVGMSGIAEVLLTLGHRHARSQRNRDHAPAGRARGGDAYGHRAEAVADVDVVVISSAVKYPTLSARAEDPVIPRAEMLAELMRSRRAWSPVRMARPPRLADRHHPGGRLDPTTSSAASCTPWNQRALGGRASCWAERTRATALLLLSPAIAVVTNIDPEHLDYYGDYGALRLPGVHQSRAVHGVSVLFDNVNVRGWCRRCASA
jgi:UDP-N-acetylmuramate--alanine ligase